MNNFKTFALATVVSLTAFPVLAFDDTDKAAVTEALDANIAAVADGNYADAIALMPPAILENLAGKGSITVDQLKAAMIDTLKQAESTVTIEEAKYDIDAAETGTSSEGRDYAMVPTSAIVKVGEDRVQVTGSMLAVEENDQWHLFQLETPESVMTAFEVYPDLADLSPPEPTTTKLD